MSLTDNLAECARLRRVNQLPHRTIREFAWFVDVVVFGPRWGEVLPEGMDKYDPQEEGWFEMTTEEKLEAWGKAFLSYYLDKEEEVMEG